MEKRHQRSLESGRAYIAWRRQRGKERREDILGLEARLVMDMSSPASLCSVKHPVNE